MITSSRRKPATTETDLVDAGILKGVLAASNDACWCMEFGIPVDLTAPDHEVVRQVFENDPFWRLSNPAMAQLYLLKAGKLLTDMPVADIFPRNAQNEDFIRNLIANGFEADRAPALDTRYDGVQIYVENDVRGCIENGRLIRMFGTVRDVGKHQRREQELQSELDTFSMALNAVPCAVLAVDAGGLLRLVNDQASLLCSGAFDSCVGESLFDLASWHSSESFALELLAKFEALTGRAISATTILTDPTTKSIWKISASQAGTPIAAVVTIEVPTEAESHE